MCTCSTTKALLYVYLQHDKGPTLCVLAARQRPYSMCTCSTTKALLSVYLQHDKGPTLCVLAARQRPYSMCTCSTTKALLYVYLQHDKGPTLCVLAARQRPYSMCTCSTTKALLYVNCLDCYYCQLCCFGDGPANISIMMPFCPFIHKQTHILLQLTRPHRHGFCSCFLMMFCANDQKNVLKF